MNFVFHPEAQRELNDAVEHYERIQPGLGSLFLEEAYAAVRRICAYPQAWARLSKQTRRCLTQRFPYGVIYRILHDQVLILAVAHLNRSPGYWSKRIKTPPTTS